MIDLQSFTKDWITKAFAHHKNIQNSSNNNNPTSNSTDLLKQGKISREVNH